MENEVNQQCFYGCGQPAIKFLIILRFGVAPKQNLISEVKSAYTFQKDLDKNMAKAEATLLNGFRYDFIICNIDDWKHQLLNNLES